MLYTFGDPDTYVSSAITWTATKDCYICGGVFVKTIGKDASVGIVGGPSAKIYAGISGILEHPISPFPVKKGQTAYVSGPEFCSRIKAYEMF